MGGQAEAAGDAVGIVRSEARKIRTPLTECPDLESEEVVTPADITRRGGITRARVTQVMGMLRLPSEIQEKILSMPDIVRRPSISERMLRPIAAIGDYGDQPREFRKLPRGDLPSGVSFWALRKAGSPTRPPPPCRTPDRPSGSCRCGGP